MTTHGNGVLNPIEAKSAKRIWGERFIYAFMIAVVTLALIVLAATIHKAYFRDAPVRVIQIDEPPQEPLCPGDDMSISNMITVRRPTVILIYISVMNETTDYNIPNSNIILEPRPHPHPATFQQDIPWEVPPSLPPGKYNRTVTMRSHISDDALLFMHQPFEVGGEEICQDD